MNLRSTWIDGFGIFRDTGLRELRPGATVFLGNNEAGKSTALAFFRTMLFGFADGRTREAQYPPLRGGRHGGRLTLVTDAGRQLTLERAPGTHGGTLRMTDAEGGDVSPSVLESVLGGVTREVFRTVYGFGLDELQSLESLQSDEINAAVYSGAAGAGLQGLPTARRVLERRRSELYAPRGRKPAVNQDLKALAAIRTELAEARAGVEEYGQLERARKQAAECAEECGRLSARCGARLAAANRKLDIWPEWIRLRDLEKQMAALPGCDPVAVESVAPDVDALVARRQTVCDERDERTRQLAALECELRNLSVDDVLLKHEQAIADLSEDLPLYREACGRAVQLDAAFAEISRAASEGLAELGQGWSEEQICALGAEFFTREEIRTFQRQSIGAAQFFRERSVDVRGLEERLADAHARLKSYADDDVGPDIGENEIMAQLAAVRDCRRAVDSELMMVREFELRGAESARLGAAGRRIRSVMWCFGAALLLVGGVAAAVGRGPGNDWSWAFPFGIALMGLGLAGAAAGTIWYRAQSPEGENAHTEALRRDIDELRFRITAFAEKLGCNVRRDRELDCVENDLLAQKAALADRERRKMERARLEDDLGRIQRRYAEALREQEQAKTGLHKLRKSWNDWLAGRGLPPRLSPESAADALDRMAELRELFRKRDAQERERSRLEMETTAFEGRLRDLLRATRRAGPRQGEAGAAAEALRRDAAEARRHATLREERQRTVASERERLRQCEKQIEAVDRELLELCGRVQADSVAAFRTMAAAAASRRRLETEIRACRGALAVGLGTNDMESIRSELCGADRDEIETEARLLQQDSVALEEQREKARNEMTQCAVRMEALAGADEIARLRQDEEAEREVLREHARRWAVTTTAQLLLDEAQRRFEKARKPDVIREAERLFSIMTDNKYTQLSAPLGEERIEVVQKNGDRKTPDELSRGTAEQLYLALRFGYALTHARGAETFPLIMDDVLVNFDPQRAAAAVQAIVTLARARQVFYFTCHPDTAHAFCDVSSETDLVILEDGEFRTS